MHHCPCAGDDQVRRCRPALVRPALHQGRHLTIGSATSRLSWSIPLAQLACIESQCVGACCLSCFLLGRPHSVLTASLRLPCASSCLAVARTPCSPGHSCYCRLPGRQATALTGSCLSCLGLPKAACKPPALQKWHPSAELRQVAPVQARKGGVAPLCCAVQRRSAGHEQHRLHHHQQLPGAACLACGVRACVSD